MFGYACIGLAVVGLHSFLTKTVFICSVRPLLVCIVFLRKLRIEEIQYICCKRRLQMFFCQACIFPNSRTFVSEVNEWHCKIVQLCVQQRFVCLSNKTSYNIYSVTTASYSRNGMVPTPFHHYRLFQRSCWVNCGIFCNFYSGRLNYLYRIDLMLVETPEVAVKSFCQVRIFESYILFKPLNVNVYKPLD